MGDSKGIDLPEICLRIREALDISLVGVPRPNQVPELNKAGIAEMMKGNPEKALNLFLQALASSGTSHELQAQSLANIGDLVRRIKGGSPEFSREILDWTCQLSQTLTTKSRVTNMLAMTYAPETTGDQSDEAIGKHLRHLQEAITLAQRAQHDGEDLTQALAAEIFAVRRMTASIIDWGNDQQRLYALKLINDIWPELDPDSEDAFKFQASKATLLRGTDLQQAAELFEKSAMGLAESSPIDAAAYFAQAADCLLNLGQTEKAATCFDQAEDLAALDCFAGSGLTELFDRVHQKLAAGLNHQS